MILKFYEDIYAENKHKLENFSIPNLWFIYSLSLFLS
jgi:hypothetical protein